jgi:hypothetical protein
VIGSGADPGSLDDVSVAFDAGIEDARLLGRDAATFSVQTGF